MKIKTILIALGFVAVFILAGSLLSSSKGNDFQTRSFIADFNQFTNDIAAAIGDPAKPDFETAFRILNEKQEDLKNRYKGLRQGKDFQVSFSTQTALDKCLDDNFKKIANEIPEKYLEQMDKDLEELKMAKQQFERKKDTANLNIRKEKLEKLQQDGELLEKVQQIVDGYKSIMQ